MSVESSNKKFEFIFCMSLVFLRSFTFLVIHFIEFYRNTIPWWIGNLEKFGLHSQFDELACPAPAQLWWYLCQHAVHFSAWVLGHWVAGGEGQRRGTGGRRWGSSKTLAENFALLRLQWSVCVGALPPLVQCSVWIITAFLQKPNLLFITLSGSAGIIVEENKYGKRNW